MRIYHLVRALAEDAAVTLVAYAEPGTDPSPTALGSVCDDIRLVPWRPPRGAARRASQVRSLTSRAPFHSHRLHAGGMQPLLDALLRTPFDVVQVEASPMMSFRYRTEAPVVLDEHNVESEVLHRQRQSERSVLRRAFNGVEAHKYAALERRAWNDVAACVVTSPREVPLVRRVAIGTPVAVVPNGVDPTHFSPDEWPVGRDPARVVFTGLLSYRPNLDGIRWFVDHVLPLVRRQRPEVEVTIVGQGTAGELAAVRANGVEVTGLVDDLRPHLARAGCVVAPIRMGGGTRLKVLEALSMACPLVSTTLGCEGIDVVAGRHLLVADEPQAFADSVVRLLGDADVASRLGREGRRLVEADYSWRRSGDQLRALHDEVLATHP